MASLRHSSNYSHFIPFKRLGEVKRETLIACHSKHFLAENCFLSAVGIDHETLVRLVDVKFACMSRENTVVKTLKEDLK